VEGTSCGLFKDRGASVEVKDGIIISPADFEVSGLAGIAVKVLD
jgi:hypothetical protein